jgi:nucleoside-diphosphate-sugar epimerase
MSLEAQCDARVLITGADGFVGSHCVDKLAARGFTNVRCAVLNASSKSACALVSHVQKTHGLTLKLVQCDVLKDDGWPEALFGCAYLIHTAAPVDKYRTEEEVRQSVRIAIEGTRRVVQAAMRAGVNRIVMTSSQAAAIAHPANQPLYPCGGYKYDPLFDCERYQATEADWTPTEELPLGYLFAKTQSEREAWACVEGSATQLVTINPAIILGPPLHKDMVGFSTAQTMRSFFGESATDPQGGSMSLMFQLGVPPIAMDVVDVRDVAEAHIRSLLSPAAASNRYLLCGHAAHVPVVVSILANQFNPAGHAEIAPRSSGEKRTGRASTGSIAESLNPAGTTSAHGSSLGCPSF